MDRFDAIRKEVCTQAGKMCAAGLVTVSAGNLSARLEDDSGLMAVTPTSIPWDQLEASHISVARIADGEAIDSQFPMSSEMPLHLAIYRARKDVGGIVHTHSPYVSALSVLQRPLPPVIDEMAAHFGGEVPVAQYAFTGTLDLGENVVATLGSGPAVILANHGNVCVGTTVAEALELAIRMEATAEIYVLALQAGDPVPLPEDAIRRGREMYLARRDSRK